MYELRDASIAQRITLAAISGVWVAISWWLLFGGGLNTAGGWFGWTWRPGDPVRRACLAAGFSIYYIRILFTEFIFLKRGVSWSEVFTVAPWILCIYVLLGVAGGTNPRPSGIAVGIGVVLFLAGSWTNSYAEYARHIWKQRPENHGRLYTEGLFRYTRHPNYFGDLLSFSGLCLISGAWVTAPVPVIMLAGFVFVNVPMLDSHLRDHYGAAFDEYARRTQKLIPFLY
jgi:protein-S-isoprenylcysteine O-methyltransferase Ste14